MSKEIDELLIEFELQIVDLDEGAPAVFLSNAAALSDGSDGLLDAADRSLGAVAETKCIMAVLIDVFTESDRWTWGLPNPDGLLPEPSWKVYLVGRQRSNHFLMHRGTQSDYEIQLTAQMESIVSDSDVIG
jgi:hypothetical protein